MENNKATSSEGSIDNNNIPKYYQSNQVDGPCLNNTSTVNSTVHLVNKYDP